MDELLGTEVGSYRLIRVLGEGGMGRVYVGEQAEIASRVAIKILTTKDPDLVSRFFAEARAVNVIKHPGLVKVLGLSHLPDGRPYIIMELVEGETLRTLIVRDSPLSMGGVLDMMKQLLAALGAAHARSVVHRDLKPDNIMVTPDGSVKILDFGIAKLSTTLGGGNLTQVGAQIGTPAYMAPEQIRGEEVDARTDLYAAGVVLYEALTGRNPFEAVSEYELVKGHLEAPPPTLSVRRRDVPDALEKIVQKVLAKKPAERYVSAKELSAALDAVDIPPHKLRGRLPVTGARAFDAFRATLDDDLPAANERATLDERRKAEHATRDDRASERETRDERGSGRDREVPPETIEYKRPSERVVEAARVAPSRRRFWWVPIPIVLVVGVVVALLAVHHGDRTPVQPQHQVRDDASVQVIDAAVVEVRTQPADDAQLATIDAAVESKHPAVRTNHRGSAAPVAIDAGVGSARATLGTILPTDGPPVWKPTVDAQRESTLFTRTMDFDPKHFDPLGYLAKARAHARELIPDAELYAIHMYGLKSNGEVDIVTLRSPRTSSVTYMFASSVPTCSLTTVTPSRDRVVVQGVRPTNCTPSFAGPKCTVSQIWARAKPSTTTVDLVVSPAQGWQIGTDLYKDDCK